MKFCHLTIFLQTTNVSSLPAGNESVNDHSK